MACIVMDQYDPQMATPFPILFFPNDISSGAPGVFLSPFTAGKEALWSINNIPSFKLSFHEINIRRLSPFHTTI